MRIIFDTNVYRDAQRGLISEKDIERAIRKLQAGRHSGCISPLNLIELGSHIQDDERNDFEVYRDAFRTAVRLCKQAVIDPETFLRSEIFRYPVDGMGLAPDETLQISRAIAAASCYEELVQGQTMQWNGVLSRVSFHAGYLNKFRTDYEAQYIADMFDNIVSIAVPDHQERRAAGRMANIDDPVLRARVLEFINSTEFQVVFFGAQAARVGVALFGELTECDKQSMIKIDAFGRAYRWILSKIVEAGYNPGKNKNDYNDIHFLLYLAADDVLLITRDSGIARKVTNSSPQGTRILTFEEWLTIA